MSEPINTKIIKILNKHKYNNITSSRILKIEDDINEIPEVYNIIVKIIDNNICVTYKIDEVSGTHTCELKGDTSWVKDPNLE